MTLQKDSISILGEYGISPSPQRIAIFDFLRKNPVHPTADVIFREIRKTLPTVSLTTVYNTLKLLSAKHAVQEVLIEDGELRFDADLREHAHFKCLHCGKVLDLFPDSPVPFSASLPPLPEGCRATEIHLCVRGICAECGSTRE